MRQVMHLLVGFAMILSLGLGGGPQPAQAQTAAAGQAYVQLEAYPDPINTDRRVRAYAQLLDDVRAFRLASGWYGIAAGPYTVEAATARLAELRGQGLAPSDAYVEIRPIYITQVFPEGGAPPAAAAPAPAEPQAADVADPAATEGEETTAEATPEPQPEPQPEPEETLAQARQSEAQLDRAGREGLQIALQWFGLYNSGIDGAFGPGTRSAMQAWQIREGLEPTGVLTTRQRDLLLTSYRDELDALGMRIVTNTRAGIELSLPMAMVAFDSYDFPFAKYEPVGDSGVQVLLISQEGSARTLGGLYEIMQTLEIVPLDGARERRGDSFVLTGQSESLRSHTEAYLRGDTIKGFTLIWPPERDAQMARVLPMMQDSFTTLVGALDPSSASEDTRQGADLMAGMEIRQPDLRRSGFYVTAQGAVMTTTELVEGQCARILIDDIHEAELVTRDEALGLAILRPTGQLAPVAYANFASDPVRAGSTVSVAGFPYGGALGAASLNAGSLAALTGLAGEDSLNRLTLSTEASEAGGPVLAANGQVLGMLLPQPSEGRSLPPGVAFSLASNTLTNAVQNSGVGFARSRAAPNDLGAQALARLGADMTVLVSCWN